ncbi:hypothetical protein ANAEL_00858 [Anaerolineales bacterium]|nr:hypothetical protein ANAEL_00858 [Anaerolineales bacterium]
MKRIKNHSQKVTRIITREEEAKIVRLLRSPEHRGKSYHTDVADLVEVLADTGMRVGEALGLRKEDICFMKRLITVRVTKGHHRPVPMTRRVATILKRRQEAGQDRPPFNLSDMQIRMAWSWARVRIGIDDAGSLVLYSLRKSCAKRLVDAGVDLAIVYAWLGYGAIRKEHRSVRLPLKKLKTAAEMLDRLNLSRQ